MKQYKKTVSGWGHFPAIKATVLQPETVAEVQEAVQQYPQLITRGGGNSYGDSSLYKVILSTCKLNRILSEESDRIEVQAGITFRQILQYLVARHKFLAVMPGTQEVSVGGAIAADVHGKNHIHAGSFFNITESLQIVLANGQLCTCSRTQDPELFRACFGGMGLKGVIVSAVIHFMPLSSCTIEEQQYFAHSLPEMLTLMQQHKHAPYLVGWLDMLSKDFKGIVKTGAWATEESNEAMQAKAILTIPFRLPVAPPRFLFRWYNRLYWKKANRHPVHLLHYSRFFYPLDSIRNWRYVFGKKGLLQYHFVLPATAADAEIATVMQTVKHSGAICTLAVLKRFGKGNSETPQAFAEEGYNLALDFIRNRKAIQLICRLDELMKRYGGKIYKAKDALSQLPQPMIADKFQSVQNKRYERK